MEQEFQQPNQLQINYAKIFKPDEKGVIPTEEQAKEKLEEYCSSYFKDYIISEYKYEIIDLNAVISATIILLQSETDKEIQISVTNKMAKILENATCNDRQIRDIARVTSKFMAERMPDIPVYILPDFDCKEEGIDIQEFAAMPLGVIDRLIKKVKELETIVCECKGTNDSVFHENIIRRLNNK